MPARTSAFERAGALCTSAPFYLRKLPHVHEQIHFSSTVESVHTSFLAPARLRAFLWAAHTHLCLFMRLFMGNIHAPVPLHAPLYRQHTHTCASSCTSLWATYTHLCFFMHLFMGSTLAHMPLHAPLYGQHTRTCASRLLASAPLCVQQHLLLPSRLTKQTP